MIGTTLSHYKITAKLGEGGMGEVYRAEDTMLGRDVAIKVLPTEMASDPELLARFDREAKAVAALNHPNIVTVYSVEEADGVHFFTMELVEGETLGRMIPPGGMPIEKFLDLAVPVADALAEAHEQGIAHRDLKPGNIMVDQKGRAKVLDFGLAKLWRSASALDASQLPTEEVMTQEGMILGTCAYMSPEQAQGQAVDSRSDIFSLGIVLYEMATGSRPFKGDNKLSILTAIMRDTPEPVSDSSPALPPALSEIIARCLRKDPAKRYADANGLKEDLERLQTEVVSGITSTSGLAVAPQRSGGARRFAWIGVAVAVAILGVAFFTWTARRNTRIEWARTEAIPRIHELQQQSSWLESGTRAWEAHELAAEAALYLGDDPTLEAAWESVTDDVTIQSQPPGADVWAKPYSDPESEWRRVGRTPLESIRFPAGNSRLRLDLAGHITAYDLLLNTPLTSGRFEYQLHPEGSVPEEMMAVPGGEWVLSLPGIDHLETEPTRDFFMDRYETTNREYKRFVDAGGYQSPERWPTPLVRDGQEVSWEEAMELFVDSTGRPGPATWEVGDYPEGLDDYPVSGVSWFEAMAFAKWADKSLPTLFHWNQVALTWSSGEIIPLSNLGGAGLAPVDSFDAMHRYGVYGMAGNVREWVYNETSDKQKRFILGGGWNDEPYAFNDAYAQSPWDRSPSNGFRSIRYANADDATIALTRDVDQPFRDFYAETPASDETFAIWLKQYDYDPSPLNATVEAQEEYEDWTRETITFDAAYGDERMMAYLFLPKTGVAPFQAVVNFPGSNGIHTDSSADREGRYFDFLLKSGRAVMLPIYKGTYERGDDLNSDYADETNFYKEHVIMWSKDLSRSIDYLETRDDIDLDRLAYYGTSWGGALGAILPAIEKRIRINLLYVAGLMFQRALPEVDQVHYLSRVTVPTVMINGEFDFFFPSETSQKPFFDLLGTPEEHKRYVVYPGSHAVPRRELIKEVLAWLDRYSEPS